MGRAGPAGDAHPHAVRAGIRVGVPDRHMSGPTGRLERRPGQDRPRDRPQGGAGSRNRSVSGDAATGACQDTLNEQTIRREDRP